MRHDDQEGRDGTSSVTGTLVGYGGYPAMAHAATAQPVGEGVIIGIGRDV